MPAWRTLSPAGWLVVLVAAGCSAGGDGSSAVSQSTNLDELVEAVDCDDVREIDSYLAPIRGGAASRGVLCTTALGPVHLFEREPVPGAAVTGETRDPGFIAEARTLERIDALLDVGRSTPGCDVSVLVTDLFFAVADQVVLEALGERLGDPVRPAEPASPTVSYLAAGCDLLSSAVLG